MPLYNTASTASALQVSHKWLDNLLSHNKISGVQQARQGVPRRVSIDAVMVVAIAKTLTESAGIATPAAVELASQLVTSPTGTVTLPNTVTLSVDLDALRHAILDRLAHAVEVTPHRVRGRPVGS